MTQQPTCGRMHSWQGEEGISTMMTTATTTTKTRGDFDDDDTGTTTKTPTARTTTISFFDTTTNLWLDAFLAGRVCDFDDDVGGNNNHKDKG